MACFPGDWSWCLNLAAATESAERVHSDDKKHPYPRRLVGVGRRLLGVLQFQEYAAHARTGLSVRSCAGFPSG